MFSGAVSYCIAPDSVQLYQLFRSKESCLIYFMLIKETVCYRKVKLITVLKLWNEKWYRADWSRKLQKMTNVRSTSFWNSSCMALGGQLPFSEAQQGWRVVHEVLRPNKCTAVHTLQVFFSISFESSQYQLTFSDSREIICCWTIFRQW